ncbi:hypothetical protein P7C70_g5722, partial [Phenoliferia sp. Uapishka_3]
MNRLKNQSSASQGSKSSKSGPPVPPPTTTVSTFSSSFHASSGISSTPHLSQTLGSSQRNTRPPGDETSASGASEVGMEGSFSVPQRSPISIPYNHSPHPISLPRPRLPSPPPTLHPRSSYPGQHVDGTSRSPTFFLSSTGSPSPNQLPNYGLSPSPRFFPSPSMTSFSSLGWPGASPVFSSPASSYISSNADPLMSPLTPSSLSSPAFRLSLDSPAVGSPRYDPESYSGEPIGDTAGPISIESSPYIRLPPMNSFGAPQARQPADIEPSERTGRRDNLEHKRSDSDFGPRTTLPPIRGLVESIGLSRSPSYSPSAPGSPAESLQIPLAPSPLLTALRNATTSSTTPNHEKSHRQRPSSLNPTLLQPDEEHPSLRDTAETDEPVGLGMLAVASEFVEESDGRQTIFEQARRMSHTPGVNR